MTGDRLQVTERNLTITNYQLPITNYQLPITKITMWFIYLKIAVI
ncbi:alpha/beta hydrolase [Sphaerospermopsis sp. LEGE 00249]|nr:alpha/beta hydrolase [Sphaerospermopsis sp. LEGE 00249]